MLSWTLVILISFCLFSVLIILAIYRLLLITVKLGLTLHMLIFIYMDDIRFLFGAKLFFVDEACHLPLFVIIALYERRTDLFFKTHLCKYMLEEKASCGNEKLEFLESSYFTLDLFFFFFFFCATPVAHGGSQPRGLIGAVTASLRHSHSNARSEPRLRPTPQLMARQDP